ncbi:expressed unknown protein [Seminavis robusta]|uniref:Uncharacterized protein n=1 Tax=Seminavis robusta TaxID=568900 RepID=A0A9N8EF71_9STRA|nr:expressed unknown protein [Seminavis robusta]|eukprot:Sro903_g218330.1 n/a (732) ;mRNA; f:37159-39354
MTVKKQFSAFEDSNGNLVASGPSFIPGQDILTKEEEEEMKKRRKKEKRERKKEKRRLKKEKKLRKKNGELENLADFDPHQAKLQEALERQKKPCLGLQRHSLGTMVQTSVGHIQRELEDVETRRARRRRTNCRCSKTEKEEVEKADDAWGFFVDESLQPQPDKSNNAVVRLHSSNPSLKTDDGFTEVQASRLHHSTPTLSESVPDESCMRAESFESVEWGISFAAIDIDDDCSHSSCSSSDDDDSSCSLDWSELDLFVTSLPRKESASNPTLSCTASFANVSKTLGNSSCPSICPSARDTCAKSAREKRGDQQRSEQRKSDCLIRVRNNDNEAIPHLSNSNLGATASNEDWLPPSYGRFDRIQARRSRSMSQSLSQSMLGRRSVSPGGPADPLKPKRKSMRSNERKDRHLRRSQSNMSLAVDKKNHGENKERRKQAHRGRSASPELKPQKKEDSSPSPEPRFCRKSVGPNGPVAGRGTDPSKPKRTSKRSTEHKDLELRRSRSHSALTVDEKRHGECKEPRRKARRNRSLNPQSDAEQQVAESYLDKTGKAERKRHRGRSNTQRLGSGNAGNVKASSISSILDVLVDGRPLIRRDDESDAAVDTQGQNKTLSKHCKRVIRKSTSMGSQPEGACDSTILVPVRTKPVLGLAKCFSSRFVFDLGKGLENARHSDTTESFKPNTTSKNTSEDPVCSHERTTKTVEATKKRMQDLQKTYKEATNDLMRAIEPTAA